MPLPKDDPIDPFEGLTPHWQRAFHWLEDRLGGRIVRLERQPRWRPAWAIDLKRGDETLTLYWRGERGVAEGINEIYDLEREGRILRVLAEHGIPVPRIHATCEDPNALVLERCPGRANLADAEGESERVQVMDHYVDLLAGIHSIEPQAFEAVGLAPPPSGQTALGDFDLWEGIYRKAKRRPEPMIEFLIRWVRRHAPHRDRTRFVLSDSGQFLFEQGRVTAILDVEFGYLGDPLADLAGLRAREIFEPLGDLSRAIRRYDALTGHELDGPLLAWHTARFALYTPLSTAHVIAEPQAGIDWAQYRSFFLGQARLALQGVAEAMQVRLDPFDGPKQMPRHARDPHGSLVEQLLDQRETAPGPVEHYEAERALRIAEYLQRVDRLGPEIDAAQRADRRALLPGAPAREEEAESALESLVLEAGPDRDEELLRYFHRQVLREHELFRPAMREMEDKTAQPIELTPRDEPTPSAAD